MNIKSLINPLIFGRCGINDDSWLVTVTVLNSANESNVRIQCQNQYTLNTVTGKKKVATFNLIYFISNSGDISFNRITIKPGSINCQLHRDNIKGELYELFKEARIKNV